jgi:hypothetical protein
MAREWHTRGIGPTAERTSEAGYPRTGCPLPPLQPGDYPGAEACRRRLYSIKIVEVSARQRAEAMSRAVQCSCSSPGDCGTGKGLVAKPPMTRPTGVAATRRETGPCGPLDPPETAGISPGSQGQQGPGSQAPTVSRSGQRMGQAGDVRP